MGIFRAEITQGERYPRFHGFTYRKYELDVAVTHLWPFNHFIGCARWLWRKIRHAKYSDKDFDKEREAIRVQAMLSVSLKHIDEVIPEIVAKQLLEHLRNQERSR